MVCMCYKLHTKHGKRREYQNKTPKISEKQFKVGTKKGNCFPF